MTDHAFVDNLTLGFKGDATTDNFEVTAVATPEPNTWAMMMTGFATLGAAARYHGRGSRTVKA